jgi:hypothetical protein
MIFKYLKLVTVCTYTSKLFRITIYIMVIIGRPSNELIIITNPKQIFIVTATWILYFYTFSTKLPSVCQRPQANFLTSMTMTWWSWWVGEHPVTPEKTQQPSKEFRFKYSHKSKFEEQWILFIHLQMKLAS